MQKKRAKSRLTRDNICVTGYTDAVLRESGGGGGRGALEPSQADRTARPHPGRP